MQPTQGIASFEGIGPLLAAGRLGEAVALVTSAVKARPAEAAGRLLLAELFVLTGEHERADNQLKLAAEHAPAEQLAVSQMRWLLRAAEARRAWYEQSAVPGFVGEPSERQRAAMRLALLVRDGDLAEAAEVRAVLEGQPLPSMVFDDSEAAPARDVDDFCQHGFEVLSLDGRYLWLAPEQVVAMTLSPVRRPRDLAWRKADTVLADGREASFNIAVQYWDGEADEAHRLGAKTDWIEGPAGTTRGRGQKVWLVGEDTRNLLDVATIEHAGEAGAPESAGAPEGTGHAA